MATIAPSFDPAPPHFSHASDDPRSRLIVNSWLGADRYIALAQPTDWSDRSIQTAAEALSATSASLARTEYIADLSAPERIVRAISAANDHVRSANRARCGNEIEKHCGVGLAVVVRTGKMLTAALVAPVQVILFQGLGQTWLPSRESWTSDEAGLDGQPLGWTDAIRPTFFRAQAKDSDRVVLTCGTVGGALAASGKRYPTPAAVCAEITALGAAGEIDPFESIALSTRLAPQSVAETVRATTGELLSSVDRRARTLLANVRPGD